jgi:hypothetical protein
MRPIKFRGMSISKKVFVYGHYYEKNNAHYILSDDIEIEVFPNTVGQYTFIKDRRGKEMYYGDIYVVNSHSFNNGDFGIFEIFMDYYWFIESYLSDVNEVCNAIEIIGNIHENKNVKQLEKKVKKMEHW